MKSAFELRFQVYCLECHFLDAKLYPNGMESDSHDAASAHFFSFNLASELVGYVRLVPPDTESRFLWQAHSGELLGGAVLPPPSQSAEISRLMVRRDYRRRRGDVLSGVTVVANDDPLIGERRAESPQILLSMYRQMYQYSLANGICYWYAAMERPLARSLQRMQFLFKQVGFETDYFGPVAPFVMDLRDSEVHMGKSNPDLLAWLQRQSPSVG